MYKNDKTSIKKREPIKTAISNRTAIKQTTVSSRQCGAELLFATQIEKYLSEEFYRTIKSSDFNHYNIPTKIFEDGSTIYQQIGYVLIFNGPRELTFCMLAQDCFVPSEEFDSNLPKESHPTIKMSLSNDRRSEVFSHCISQERSWYCFEYKHCIRLW